MTLITDVSDTQMKTVYQFSGQRKALWWDEKEADGSVLLSISSVLT